MGPSLRAAAGRVRARSRAGGLRTACVCAWSCGVVAFAAACGTVSEAPATPRTAPPSGPPPEGDRGACLAGHGDACERIAASYVRTSPPPGAPPPGPAEVPPVYAARRSADRLLFRMACEQRGVPGACTALAAMMTDGDSQQAVLLLAVGCSGGSALGCALLADALSGGAGTPRDDQRAAAIRALACGWGMTRSCAELGEAFVRGSGVLRDEPRGLALLERACAGGSAEACTRVHGLRDAIGPPGVGSAGP